MEMMVRESLDWLIYKERAIQRDARDRVARAGRAKRRLLQFDLLLLTFFFRGAGSSQTLEVRHQESDLRELLHSVTPGETELPSRPGSTITSTSSSVSGFFYIQAFSSAKSKDEDADLLSALSAMSHVAEERVKFDESDAAEWKERNSRSDYVEQNCAQVQSTRKHVQALDFRRIHDTRRGGRPCQRKDKLLKEEFEAPSKTFTS